MRTTRILTDVEKAIQLPSGYELDVLLEGEQRFVYAYRFASDTCYITFHNKVISNLTIASFLMFMTEKMVRMFHPAKIVIERPASVYRRVLETQQYFPKGKDDQRVIESWRYLVGDNVFDEFGMIINQGKLKELPFGWFDTAEKGCGWISAYNLLKMNHKERTMEYCAKQLGKHALLGGIAGQSSSSLMRFLKAEGLKCEISLPSNALACEVMKKKANGIVLYNHRHGAHYAAFRKVGNGKIQLYNAVYGRKNHIDTPENFLKNNSFLPTSTVIYVAEK